MFEFALVTDYLLFLLVHFDVQVLITFGKVFHLTRQFLNIYLEAISFIKFGSQLPV